MCEMRAVYQQFNINMTRMRSIYISIYTGSDIYIYILVLETVSCSCLNLILILFINLRA